MSTNEYVLGDRFTQDKCIQIPHNRADMTLRDYFAAQALAALIRKNGADFKPEEIERRCKDAFRYADAMLKAREAA